MIGTVKAVMIGLVQSDQASARGNRQHADQARQKQVAEERKAAQQTYVGAKEDIIAAKEKAIAQGIGAVVAVAASCVGASAGLGEVGQAVVGGVGSGASDAGSAIGEAFAQNNEIAAADARHEADLARADGTRFEGISDEASSAAEDAQDRARENFRAAIDMVGSLQKSTRIGGETS
jgi:hypothetical protein